MTSCTGKLRGGYGGFEKSQKSESWVFASEEDGWLSELDEALRRVSRVVVVGGRGRWKNQHRKIVYLSCYVEKPLNSKRWIKSLIPELRSRKRFLCFGIPMLSTYELWTFYVRFTYSVMATLQCLHCVWTIVHLEVPVV